MIKSPLAQPVRKSKRTEALELAKAVRADLNEDKKPLSIILLQCRTICKYLDRLEVNEWIELEQDGYYNDQTMEEFLKKLPKYRKQRPIFHIAQNKQILPLPYSYLEQYAEALSLGEPISEIEISPVFTVTTGQVLDELNKNVNKLLRESGQSWHGEVTCYAQFSSNHLKAVVAGVRKRIWDFIDETILELEYGEIPEEIFLTLRAEVDQKLATLSPTAIEKLKNAYEKVGTSSSTEDWSHVASTCRRVIKDVADVVFPAQDTPQKDKDGKEHPVDDSHYINRIIAGMKADLGKGKNKIFTESMIDYTFNFLRGIQEYASKGDHATFQKTEAVRCLVYTYLLLGDILNYHVDKDVRNVGEVKTSEEEPDITIVNFHPEYMGSKSLKLLPNFRNDGIAARNIKIYYKVMDKFVDLGEIVANKREIQKSFFEVPGTVRHGDSVNLNDGNPESGISFPTEGSKSVVLWLTYHYGEASEGEVVIDLRYNGKEPISKHPIRYTRSDIVDLVRSKK